MTVTGLKVFTGLSKVDRKEKLAQTFCCFCCFFDSFVWILMWFPSLLTPSAPSTSAAAAAALTSSASSASSSPLTESSFSESDFSSSCQHNEMTSFHVWSQSFSRSWFHLLAAVEEQDLQVTLLCCLSSPSPAASSLSYAATGETSQELLSIQNKTTEITACESASTDHLFTLIPLSFCFTSFLFFQ